MRIEHMRWLRLLLLRLLLLLLLWQQQLLLRRRQGAMHVSEQMVSVVIRRDWRLAHGSTGQLRRSSDLRGRLPLLRHDLGLLRGTNRCHRRHGRQVAAAHQRPTRSGAHSPA